MEVEHPINGHGQEALSTFVQPRTQELATAMQIDPATALAANSILSLIQTSHSQHHQQILQQLHHQQQNLANLNSLTNGFPVSGSTINYQAANIQSPTIAPGYVPISHDAPERSAGTDVMTKREPSPMTFRENQTEEKESAIKVLRQNISIPPTGNEGSDIQHQLMKAVPSITQSQQASALPSLTSITTHGNDLPTAMLSPYDMTTFNHNNALLAQGRYRTLKLENGEQPSITELSSLHFANGTLYTPTNPITNELLQGPVTAASNEQQNNPTAPIYVQMQNGALQAIPSSASAAQFAINTITNLPQGAFYHPSQMKTVPAEEVNHMMFQNNANSFPGHLINDENPMVTVSGAETVEIKPEGHRRGQGSRQCKSSNERSV